MPIMLTVHLYSFVSGGHEQHWLFSSDLEQLPCGQLHPSIPGKNQWHGLNANLWMCQLTILNLLFYENQGWCHLLGGTGPKTSSAATRNKPSNTANFSLLITCYY